MNSTWLNCVQCDDLFEFTAAEQARYERLDFDPPRRCPACRRHKFKESGEAEGRRFREKKKTQRPRSRQRETDFV